MGGIRLPRPVARTIAKCPTHSLYFKHIVRVRLSQRWRRRNRRVPNQKLRLTASRTRPLSCQLRKHQQNGSIQTLHDRCPPATRWFATTLNGTLAVQAIDELRKL